MTEMVKRIKGFLADEEGATAVEYGVLVALIIAVCVVIIAVLGRQINVGFNQVSTALTGAGITDPGVGGS